MGFHLDADEHFTAALRTRECNQPYSIINMGLEYLQRFFGVRQTYSLEENQMRFQIDDAVLRQYGHGRQDVILKRLGEINAAYEHISLVKRIMNQWFY
jgi:hypothetical protein